MAWQTAEKFLELLATNANLQTHRRLANAWTIPEVTRFAASKGFIFSEEDLKVALESTDQYRLVEKR